MDNAVLSRRALLAGGATVAGVAALGVGAAAPAEAATATIKKVVMYRVGRFSYNSRTRVTTVKSYTKVSVTARFVGSNVFLMSSRKKWVQIPYTWSKTKKGLWYNHYLKLQLDAAAAKAAALNSPTGGYKVIPPATFASASAYHSSSDWARHLLRRAAYGPNAADLADVKRLGYAAWLEQQLNPSSIDDSACDCLLYTSDAADE